MAGTKLSDLSASGAVAATDIFYSVVTAGVGGVKATAAQVKTFMSAAPTITGHPVVEGVTSTGATGTGNFVFSVSPTLTGTLAAAAGTFSSTLGVIGAATLGTQQTTQGSLVLANTAAGAFATTVKSSNSATAGYTLTLPVDGGTNAFVLQTNGSGVTSWVAQSGGSGGVTIGTTTVTSGATTNILYNNAGVVGEYTLTGTGTVVAMKTSPTFITPVLGIAAGTSLALGGATIGSNALAVTGTAAFGGALNANSTFTSIGSTVLVASLAINSGTGNVVMWNGAQIGWSSSGAVTTASTNDTSFVRAAAASISTVSTFKILSGTAIPAGGTAGTGYSFSSTANFGVFGGSGAPSLVAAQGSLYLRSDGTSITRAYINTDGSTGWTALVSVA